MREFQSHHPSMLTTNILEEQMGFKQRNDINKQLHLRRLCGTRYWERQNGKESGQSATSDLWKGEWPISRAWLKGKGSRVSLRLLTLTQLTFYCFHESLLRPPSPPSSHSMCSRCSFLLVVSKPTHMTHHTSSPGTPQRGVWSPIHLCSSPSLVASHYKLIPYQP